MAMASLIKRKYLLKRSDILRTMAALRDLTRVVGNLATRTVMVSRMTRTSAL